MEGETNMPRPFAVEYDPDAETYYVFAPEGCVLVDGVAAQIEGAENGNVALDLDAEDLPDYLYAHVAKGSDGRWDVTFDGEGEKDGAKWNVRVTRFGGAENDGDQYDLLTSAISLSEGGGLPRPFDIEDGKVVRCKIYCGNRLCTCDDHELQENGDIWLRIERTTDGYSLSVAEGTPSPSADWTATTAYVKIYERTNGEVTCDMRPGYIPLFGL